MKSVVSSQELVVRKYKQSVRIFFIFFLSTAYYLLPTVSAADEVERIQEAYKNITDIKGTFVQKSHIKDLGRTDTYKGSFLIKMPAKIRWEYKGEKSQTVVISDDRIMIYNKSEKQAFKGIFNRNTYGQAPVALLSGFGNIKEEFNATGKNNRLILTPKNPMGNIVSIEVAVSGDRFPIKSFTINDSRSNRIEISLSDVEINTGVKDSIFNFSLPEGTGVYEYNP